MKTTLISSSLLTLIFTLGVLSAAGQRPTAQSTPDAPLNPEAKRQISVLNDEKQSRTPAQRKIDSNLLYAIKKNRRDPIFNDLPTLETGVKTNDDGFTDVEITAHVTTVLLKRLRALDARIIALVPEFRSITASVPIDSIEDLAALNEVIFIRPKPQPILRKRPRLSFFYDGYMSELLRLFDVPELREQTVAPDHFFFGDEPRPGSGSRTSEGDVTHAADSFRGKTGFNGAGVKIGVLSDGIKSLAASQASGDLPQNVTVLPGQAGPADADEGTAMLEIVNDLAPGAQLFFATADNGLPSYAKNIRDLRAAGCEIIVDDVGYGNESPFQDGQAAAVISNLNGGAVTQAVNDVTVGAQGGALYFSAGGNDGNKDDGTTGTWEGDFVNGGDLTVTQGTIPSAHNFGGLPYDTITQESGSGIALQWSDPLGASANDYDLIVLNSTGTSVVAQGNNTQSGTQDPVELVSAAAVVVGNRIVISKYSGSARFLHLALANEARLAISTDGNLFGHSASLNTISMGATPSGAASTEGVVGPFPNPFTSANRIEKFSSDGPRRTFYRADGIAITPGNTSSTGGTLLQKPDLTAADGVTTTLAHFTPFSEHPRRRRTQPLSPACSNPAGLQPAVPRSLAP